MLNSGFARTGICTLSLTLFVISGSAVWAQEAGAPKSGPTQDGQKEWSWDGANSLAFSVPGTLHYQQGGAPRIVVTGPEHLLSHVQVGGGHIALDSDMWNFSDEKVDVVVSGIPLNSFASSGSSEIQLGRIQQDALEVKISGRGLVAGEGRVENLRLSISGSGKADFSGLKAKQTDARISGGGVAVIAPEEKLQVAISGSGIVRMTQRPAEIRTQISGSGRVFALDGQGHSVDVSHS
jgi:hypothetical protein